MELTRTLYLLCCASQIFGLLSEKEIIEKVILLSETQFDYIRLENLNKTVVKALISHFRIELKRSNISQELNSITFCANLCETGINHLEQYLLQKNILIIELNSQNEEK